MVETLWMDTQRRVHPSRRLFQQCDLDTPVGETVSFWGAIGEFGQIQLLPATSELSKIRDSLPDSVTAEDMWDAGNDDYTRVRRQLQTFLKVRVHARSREGKVEMVFYAEAVDQGHLAIPRCTVVVTTTGKILEVWSAEKWRRFSRIGDLRQFTEQARTVLVPITDEKRK